MIFHSTTQGNAQGNICRAAPPHSHHQVSASDEAYVEWNLRLLHNTGLANLLDGCAASVPCHAPGEPPVGLTLGGMGGADKQVLAVAVAVERALAPITSPPKAEE